jgi:hypothetical protein
MTLLGCASSWRSAGGRKGVDMVRIGSSLASMKTTNVLRVEKADNEWGHTVDVEPEGGVYPAWGNGSKNGRTVSVGVDGKLFVPGHWCREFGIDVEGKWSALVEEYGRGVRVRFSPESKGRPWKLLTVAPYCRWLTGRVSVWKEVGRYCRVGRGFKCASYREGEWLVVVFPEIGLMERDFGPPEVAVSPAEGLARGDAL